MLSFNTFKGYFVVIVSYLYALLFVYAAVSKLLDFENFRVQLGQSPLLSAFAGWVAVVVPVVEIVIAVLLLTMRFRKIGLYAALILMAMFTAYIYIILNYSAFIPCSCGGILEKMGWDQHLIFNVLFLILAGAALLVLPSPFPNDSKFVFHNRIIYLLLSSAFGFGCMALLFFLSEQIMHSQNTFIRRFPPNPDKDKSIDLQFNSYYYAGSDGNKIYLGNYMTPLVLTETDSSLSGLRTIRLEAQPLDFPFRTVQVRVAPPYFYIADGTVPVVYRGRTSDWQAHVQYNDKFRFTAFEIIDSTQLVCSTAKPENGETVLAQLHFGLLPQVKYYPTLLEKQIDGIFDVDGKLLYDRTTRQIAYTYYYRNQFIIADNRLNLLSRGKTIDTISRAQITVAYLPKQQLKKMASPPLTVNENAAIDGNLLYVHSKLRGRYDRSRVWNEASVIDVYNVDDHSYISSFCVYDIDRSKLRGYFVQHGHFYGFIGQYLMHATLPPALTAKKVSKP